MASADPVGTLEIAERLGVTRVAVDKWRQRDLGFPEPKWTVGGRPAWEWRDVAAWASRTGRLMAKPVRSDFMEHRGLDVKAYELAMAEWRAQQRSGGQGRP